MDLKSHSFQADIYVWMRWKDTEFDPTATMEIMNPYELWALSKIQTYDEPIVLPNKDFYQVVRLHGTFSEKFDLAHYPFDPQSVHIDIEDNRLDSEKVVYQIGEGGVTVNPDIELPGFVIGNPSLTVKQVAYPTNFGEYPLGLKFGANNHSYSRIHLYVPITRPMLPYAAKLLIPVLCVVFCASLMFLFNPTYVDSRVGIGITALLTVVALQITLNEDLPDIDYLVLIDKVYLATYLYVIAGLAVVVKTTWMFEKDQANVLRAIRVDQWCLIGLTFVYLAVLGALIGAAIW